jgi:hypothetical protein
MDNIETRLQWIKDIAEQLQAPQTYNERQRLTKIMVEAMPLIIKTLEETAHSGYGTQELLDDGSYDWISSGYTCNGCGYDHRFKTAGISDVDDCRPITDRSGNVIRKCEVNTLLDFLKELEENST